MDRLELRKELSEQIALALICLAVVKAPENSEEYQEAKEGYYAASNKIKELEELLSQV